MTDFWNSLPLAPLLWVWAGCAVLQLALWALAVRVRNAGWVDFGWAASLGLSGVGLAIFLDGDPARRILVGAVAGLWGLRLAFHLLFDRVWGHPEEGRYVALRSHWGDRANLHFLWFFQAQALLAAILALPFALAARSSAPFPHLADLVGGALFLTGILGETVADRQLAAWKADPANRGRTCRSGLWGWSRHPNYFFEWVLWCGFAALAASAPAGGAAWVSPLLIFVFVRFITGIPPTEKQAVRSRGDDYRDYQRTVNAFFPWPPRGASRPRPDRHREVAP